MVYIIIVWRKKLYGLFWCALKSSTEWERETDRLHEQNETGQKEKHTHTQQMPIYWHIHYYQWSSNAWSLWLPHTLTQKTNKTRLERRTKLEHTHIRNFICLLSLKMGSFGFIQWMMKKKKSVIPQRRISFFSGTRAEISSSIAFETIECRCERMKKS